MSRSLITIGYSVMLVLLVPPIVFVVDGLVAGMSAGAAFTAMLAQYGVSRANLLVTGVLGLIPLLLIGVVLWVCKARNCKPDLRASLFRSGMLGMLLVLVWSNHEFWRVYLPEQTAPGFPHGLELVIGPLFFAPVAIVVAMIVAWAVVRFKR